MLKVESTPIQNCFILKPTIHYDKRGYFSIPYNSDEINQICGKEIKFVQDNQSYSKYGVIRGLHFQKQPYQQTKLVRCVLGRVLDVIVDIDKNSPTYGKHISVNLSDEDMTMVLVPNTCAHGFSTLSDEAIFEYKVDNYWHKDAEECIAYNDPDLGIDWKIPTYIRNISEKDMAGKFLKDIKF
jgi:dTDP-4-dehydrorhamnose 3,5-epimerase